MIIVTGSITARADAREALQAVAQAHVRRSRTVAGCLTHEVLTDVDDPLRLVFIETWSDMASLQAHLATPETRGFGAMAAELGGGPQLTIYEANVLRRIPSPQ